jgi:hypothetical protein
MLVTIAKYATGLFYLIGGPLIHLYLITQQRHLYTAVDDTAASLYQSMWNGFVLPNLIPLVILLIGLEMVAGALMILPQPGYAQLGQAAGAFFNVLLVPFWFFYAIPNLLLVSLHLWVLQSQRRTHPKVLRSPC